MRVQFNWYELQNITRVPENQLLLIYALYVGFEKRLSMDFTLLQSKLHIDAIYSDLFNRRFLIKTDYGIFSNYVCNDPQNYINNISFIHKKVSPIIKLEYIYILSQRNLKNPNNWIPEDYVEPQYRNNLFVYSRDYKIHFPMENTKHGTRLDKPKKTTSTRKWS